MAAIVLDGVSKVYADGTAAVSDLNLDIEDGEFIVLVGPSGCGKTTALRMVAGLETITHGTITIGDRVVNGVPPKERDIAMVFQNYALYPHMTVYDNMAFGLKLRKLDKAEIDRRVRKAGDILGLDDLLQRKPKALSGGQRQRVAMGRAIVREPEAFLMDEPLSNLDAKLRVQMRSEIARIQHELSTTTIYVTHDQVEAMTMGDRVAVIRKGVLQQIDTPQFLYDHPRNLFVAGFIGSPAMNLVEATLSQTDGAYGVTFGSFDLGLPADVFEHRPALKDHVGRSVILGLRPEDLEDASLVAEAPVERRMRARVLLREALGADVVVHLKIDAPEVLTDDTKELADDLGIETMPNAATGESTFLARLNPRTQARTDGLVDLVVDVTRLHFFDAESGLAIYDGSGSASTSAPAANAAQ